MRVRRHCERGGSEPILKRIAYEVFGLTV